MELTYWITGTDGQSYGPATLAQLQAWVVEGRVVAETQVNRSDSKDWKAASAFDELIWNRPPPQTAEATPPPLGAGVEMQAKAVRSGADWFLWIAGLSLINVVARLSGSDWGFVVGLAVTEFVSGFGKAMGESIPEAASVGLIVTGAVDLIILAVFALFGFFARKGHIWAFIVGITAYAIDTLLCLLVGEWAMLAFHCWALFCIGLGLRSAFALRRTQRS